MLSTRRSVEHGTRAPMNSTVNEASSPISNLPRTTSVIGQALGSIVAILFVLTILSIGLVFLIKFKKKKYLTPDQRQFDNVIYGEDYCRIWRYDMADLTIVMTLLIKLL